jgi:hypothetical protein
VTKLLQSLAGLASTKCDAAIIQKQEEILCGGFTHFDIKTLIYSAHNQQPCLDNVFLASKRTQPYIFSYSLMLQKKTKKKKNIHHSKASNSDLLNIR